MKEEEIKKLNIYEKMSLITDELGVIEKKLNVEMTKTKSYKAVSERDVLDAVKPLEKKYRVYSYPYERKIIDKDILTKETEYNGATTKTNTLFLRLEVVYKFINIDNTDDFVEIKSYGDGLDTGDKATGKAMTYADKYALLKAYKISTGDDPGKEASADSWNGKSKTIRKPDEQINLNITKEFNDLLIATGSDLDALIKHYEVDNFNQLTDEQKIDAIKIMKNKLEKSEK